MRSMFGEKISATCSRILPVESCTVFEIWGREKIVKQLGNDDHHQPRSQSSSAISDVTLPVKLVGKIRYRARFQASSGHSDSANRPGYEAGPSQLKDRAMDLIFFIRQNDNKGIYSFRWS